VILIYYCGVKYLIVRGFVDMLDKGRVPMDDWDEDDEPDEFLTKVVKSDTAGGDARVAAATVAGLMAAASPSIVGRLQTRAVVKEALKQYDKSRMATRRVFCATVRVGEAAL
jgi:hypothetical protein